jgi:hypothetical protein
LAQERKAKNMSESEKMPPSEEDAELEREIRQGRKFSLAEAIGRLAGPGAMKGESPIARMRQAETEIESWLRGHLVDSAGVLAIVISRAVKGSDLLLCNFDQPLVVLAACCQRILQTDSLLQEIVRAADTEWGRLMGERPYFDRPGSPSHSDDPYTIESVRRVLAELLDNLSTEMNNSGVT